MPTKKYKIKNPLAFMLLSDLENVWNTYSIDSISDETKKCYNHLMDSLEQEVALPQADIDDFEIFALYNEK